VSIQYRQQLRRDVSRIDGAGNDYGITPAESFVDWVHIIFDCAPALLFAFFTTAARLHGYLA
jgi:hypothetical protein